jgi:hypothetical protein
MRTPSRVIGGVSLAALQARFLSIKQRIVLHARIFFRHIACPARRADAIAETVGLAWTWFRRLAERGKDATKFASVLASYAARAVKSGRRVCGQLKARDVLSERAQQRHHFSVSKLPDCSTLSSNPLSEALQDNTRTEVPEQVAFRLDFPAWLRTRNDRDRRLIRAMMHGERTMDLARRFGTSASRISQLRRAYHDDWQRFCQTPTD